jgi:hypothetical protein
VFENRVLRRIFGQRRDEVTGDWRKLHNEELCNLYSSPNIIRLTVIHKDISRTNASAAVLLRHTFFI